MRRTGNHTLRVTLGVVMLTSTCAAGRQRSIASRPLVHHRCTIMAANTVAQLLTSASPTVRQLAKQNPAYRAALAAQEAVLERAAGQLSLSPVKYPIADENGVLAVSSPEGPQPSPAMGAAVRAVQGGRVRWLSASALGSAATNFGATRLTGYADASSNAPHFILEFIVAGSGAEARAQGLICLWQRSDIVLDLEYVERYYDRVPAWHHATEQPGPHPSPRTWNEIYNDCVARQAGTWRHYQAPQAHEKPLIANGIGYTFPAVGGEVEAFGRVALEVVDLWAGFLRELDMEETELVSPGLSPSRREIAAGYDARYVRSVRDDPGNAIAAQALGSDAVNRLVEMTCGQAGMAVGGAK